MKELEKKIEEALFDINTDGDACVTGITEAKQQILSLFKEREKELYYKILESFKWTRNHTQHMRDIRKIFSDIEEEMK